MSRSNLAPSIRTAVDASSRDMHAGQHSSRPNPKPFFANLAKRERLDIRQPTLGFLFLLVLLVGAGLRFYQLGVESFSYDEGIMIEATSSGWETVMANITRGRPPLIVLLGFGWIQLVGESELAVRLLPAIMGILSIGLLFRIGQMLLGDAAGLIAAAVLSISAFHLFHSQDYRYYSLLTLMTLLSTYFFLRCIGFSHSVHIHSGLENQQEDALEKDELLCGSWIEWAFYALFSACVYYAHYQGVFALVAQGLFFLTIWLRVSNRMRWRWFISQLAIGLLLLPSFLRVLLDFTAGSSDGDFQGTIGALGNLGPLSDPPFWLPFHTLLIKFLFISVGVFQQWPVVIASGLLLLIGIGVALRQNQGKMRSVLQPLAPSRLPWVQLRLLVLWAFCPVFIPFVLSKLLSPMYLPRYTISALPATCLLIAFVLIAIRRLVPIWASMGALLILVTPGIVTYYQHDFKDQWRIAAEHVRESIIQEDVALASGREQTKLFFASVNNETADRIQLLFGRYFAPENGLETGTAAEPFSLAALVDESCILSAGLTPTDALPADIATCFEANTSAPEAVWLITRTAKEGPQMLVEERLLSGIPAPWTQVSEEYFSGVIARKYTRPVDD